MKTECPEVLVVEDDRELNELVGAYLALAGFAYRSAPDGATALAQVGQRAPAAVVLDLMLPDISGFEVCTRLRADGPACRVPVIILTALDSADSREHGRQCGATEYLTKPFDPDLLIQTLARHAKSDGRVGP
ncbi:MAG TPA: response regulator [Tepidisphaeraceae bacterium]|jgi:DNA-binding response OmpR family regulator